MITDEQIILKLSSIEDPPVSRGCEFGSRYAGSLIALLGDCSQAVDGECRLLRVLLRL